MNLTHRRFTLSVLATNDPLPIGLNPQVFLNVWKLLFPMRTLPMDTSVHPLKSPPEGLLFLWSAAVFSKALHHVLRPHPSSGVVLSSHALMGLVFFGERVVEFPGGPNRQRCRG